MAYGLIRTLAYGAVAEQPPKRRTRDHWTALALTVLADEGLSAIGIEPLAKRGGATKGSLYWHFKSREELLAATLERWEQEQTDGVIAFVTQHQSPVDRLTLLFASILYLPPGVGVEPALLAGTDEPLIAAALARVAERRIQFVQEQFEQLGLSPGAARLRSFTAYTIFVGQLQVLRWAPGSAPQTPEEQVAHITDVMGILFSGTDAVVPEIEPPRG